MQLRPQTKLSSDFGLSLHSAKSKAKKLIRIAIYRRSHAPLWLARNSLPGLARARVGRNRPLGSDELRSSVHSKVRAQKVAVDAAEATRYRRPNGFSSLPSGEIHLFKAYVSLAALAAFGAGVPALTTAAPAPAPRAAAPAQQAAPTRAGLIRGLDAAFKTIDTNGDGVVSAAEAQAAEGKVQQQRLAAIRGRVEAEFTKLDTNKDGQLSKIEFMAAAPTAPSTPPNGAAIVAQLDKNKDGKISADEYRAPRLAMFDRLDTNHDGTISATERQAAAAARQK